MAAVVEQGLPLHSGYNLQVGKKHHFQLGLVEELLMGDSSKVDFGSYMEEGVLEVWELDFDLYFLVGDFGICYLVGDFGIYFLVVVVDSYLGELVADNNFVGVCCYYFDLMLFHFLKDILPVAFVDLVDLQNFDFDCLDYYNLVHPLFI
jgi:hypothetical protein